MKLIEDIIQEYVKEKGYNTFHDFLVQSTMKDIEETIIPLLMKQVHDQAVDLCLENVEPQEGAVIDYGYEQVNAGINKESILKVKDMIK